MAIQDDFVKEYMSTIATSWDDIKFIDGYPGKYVISARKKGNQWYVAGINGEKSTRTVTLDISFLPKTAKGIIISDTKDRKNLVKENILLSKPVNITLQPYGGFVIKTLSK